MERIKRLPESELKIMMIIWESDQPVTSAYVMENLPNEIKWAQTTVLNFLARLVERGFLDLSKKGRVNYYTPLVEEDDYLHQESKSFLKKMHMGSVKSFVAALYDGEAIDEEDLLELKKYVEEVSQKKIQ